MKRQESYLNVLKVGVDILGRYINIFHPRGNFPILVSYFLYNFFCREYSRARRIMEARLTSGVTIIMCADISKCPLSLIPMTCYL